MFIHSFKSERQFSRLPSIYLALPLIFLQACDSSSTTPEVEPRAVVYSDEFLYQFDNPYADDFGADTAYFRTFSFDDSIGTSSAIVSDGAIVLHAESDGNGYTNRYLRVGERVNTALVSAVFDRQTSHPEGTNSLASVGLNADLYNILANNGVDGDDPFIGHVNIDFRVSINGSDESRDQMCLGSYREDTYNPIANLADGSNCRVAPNSLELNSGELFSYGYDFDIDGRSLVVSFNEERLTIDLLGNVFVAYGNQEAGIQIIQENGTGSAVDRFTNITLDGLSYDFSMDRVVLDQIDLYSDGGSDAPPTISGRQATSI